MTLSLRHVFVTYPLGLKTPFNPCASAHDPVFSIVKTRKTLRPVVTVFDNTCESRP